MSAASIRGFSADVFIIDEFAARPPAPAIFLGLQENLPGLPAIELWNLFLPVGHHPAGSTVSRQTLESLGYFVPTQGGAR